MLLLALVANVYASCLDAPGYPDCHDVCTPEFFYAVECDIDAGTAWVDFDYGDPGPSLVVGWDDTADELDTISGYDSDGVEFCCDTAELWANAIQIEVNGYEPDPFGPANAYVNGVDFGSSHTQNYFDGYGGRDIVYGSSYPGEGSYIDVINTGGGNDEVHARAGDDYVNGGPGRDLLYGDEGDDFLNSGDTAAHPIGDYLDGGDGIDNIWGGPGPDVICGQDDADDLDGFGGNDTIYGGGDTDEIDGGTGEHDSCEGEPTRANCEHTISSCPAP